MVNLAGSKCKDISADELETSGGLLLRAGFVAQGPVRLLNTRIAGDLDCSDAKFEGRDDNGAALCCDHTEVEGGIFLRGAVVTKGGVQLLGVRLSGSLELSGARLEASDNDGYSLIGDRIEIAGSAFLRRGFIANNVRLHGAKIVGNLSCRRGRVTEINCNRAQIGGYVLLDNGFIAERKASFINATIGADLTCAGGIFGSETVPISELSETVQENSERSTEKVVLDLDRINIQGTLWLTAAEYHGAIDATGARIVVLLIGSLHSPKDGIRTIRSRRRKVNPLL